MKLKVAHELVQSVRAGTDTDPRIIPDLHRYDAFKEPRRIPR